MNVLKCKMCGKSIEMNKTQSTTICEHCGTEQTLPKLGNDKMVNLYNRANHFRRNNEYDKAKEIFETILTKDNTDAEAYWSLVLCKYAVEYIEDSTTHTRIPTINRNQYKLNLNGSNCKTSIEFVEDSVTHEKTPIINNSVQNMSIFDDDNYKMAIKYADASQKAIYEKEANIINDIQKEILENSNNDDLFDMFICYKKADEQGGTPPNSALVNDLYTLLAKEGFEVFFLRTNL